MTEQLLGRLCDYADGLGTGPLVMHDADISELVALLKDAARALAQQPAADRIIGKKVTEILTDRRELTCYECGNAVAWLAPDSRCGDCTRLTPDEVRGGVDGKRRVMHELCDCPNGRAEHARWCAALAQPGGGA